MITKIQYNTIESNSTAYNNSMNDHKSTDAISNRKHTLLTTLTYFFILVFTYASLRVLSDYSMFMREVYSLIVWEPVKWGLAAICIAEIITVCCLVIPKFRAAGVVLTFIVMCIVNVATFIVLQKAPVIPSLFGGIFPYVDFWGHLYINIFVLLLALIGLLAMINSKKAVNSPKKP